MSLQAVKTLRQIRELIKSSSTATTQEFFWTYHANGYGLENPFPSCFRYKFLTGSMFHTNGTDSYFFIYKKVYALPDSPSTPYGPVFVCRIDKDSTTGTYPIVPNGDLIVDNQHMVSMSGGVNYRATIQWLRTPY